MKMTKLSPFLKFSENLIQKVRPKYIEQNDLKLTGKVALLTGGASGIGYSIAKSFLRHGLSAITLTDNHKPNGIEAVKDLSSLFGEDKVMYIDCDSSEPNQLDWVFQQTLNHYNKIDIVVNNAGIMNDSLWQKEINLNIGGYLIGNMLALHYMARTSVGNGGLIINIASITGLIPSSGFPIHTMTQYGIVGLSRALGGHYRKTGVKVIGICPGLTQSEMVESAHKNTLDETFRRIFYKEVEGCCLQHPDAIGNGLIKIINRAKAGSIWLIENNDQPYEIIFPNIEDMIREKL